MTDQKCHRGLPLRGLSLHLVTWVTSRHGGTLLRLLLAWRNRVRVPGHCCQRPAARKGLNSFYCRREPGRAGWLGRQFEGRQEWTGRRRHFAFRRACIYVQDREAHLPLKSAINNVKKMTAMVA